MNVLSPSGTTEFLQRFYCFGDALLRNLEIDFSRRSKPITSARIRITAQDRLCQSNQKWTDILFHLEDIKEFAFCEPPKQSHIVISDDLHIGYFENLTLVDFGGLTDEPKTIEDFRRSQFYVAAGLVKWKISPYTE